MATVEQTARELRKASALVRAWRARYRVTPSLRAVVNVLSVAELETHAGDFQNAHNWGQVQRRQVTPAEQALLDAGGTPLPRDDYEILSTDTTPTPNGQRRYHVWLWKFPDDDRGADKLLSVLLDQRRTIRELIDSLSFEQLAGLMYDSHYFEGSKPRSEPGGPAANKAAYAASLARQNVAELLGTWKPTDVPDESTPSVPPAPEPLPVGAPSSSAAAPLVIIEDSAADARTSPPDVPPVEKSSTPSPVRATRAQKLSAGAVIALALAGVASIVSTILHHCGGAP